MLLKVVGSAPVDDPGELLEFKGSRTAPQNLPIDVLIEDLESVLIDLK